MTDHRIQEDILQAATLANRERARADREFETALAENVDEQEEDDYAPYQEQDYDRPPDQQGEQPSPVQEEIRENDADERAETDALEDAGA